MAKMQTLNKIGHELKRKGENQEWLAKEIGRSRVVVSNYINNNTQPSLPILYQIAYVLGVEPFDLLEPMERVDIKELKYDIQRIKEDRAKKAAAKAAK